jgi:hypothetical protein
MGTDAKPQVLCDNRLSVFGEIDSGADVRHPFYTDKNIHDISPNSDRCETDKSEYVNNPP